MIFVRRLQLGPMANFVYLVGDRKAKECLIVDPAWEIEAAFKAAAEEGCRVAGALVTHHHADHTNALGALLAKADVPVFVHAEDAERLAEHKGALRLTKGGEKIPVGSGELEVLHTPGHTHGSQSFLAGGRLLSGDTLFIDSCGRVDFPNSDPEKMYRTLRRLGELSGDTVLMPGHDYGDVPQRTMAEELESNRFLQLAQRNLETFVQVVGGGKPR